MTTLCFVIFAALEDQADREMIQYMLIAQSGAALAGAATAIPLRLVGFRLVRERSQQQAASKIA
jgi:hypothetical protein